MEDLLRTSFCDHCGEHVPKSTYYHHKELACAGNLIGQSSSASSDSDGFLPTASSLPVDLPERDNGDVSDDESVASLESYADHADTTSCSSEFEVSFASCMG